MTQQTTTPAPRNGVDTPTLFATLDAVKGQRDLAAFTFRATNRWVAGTHSRTTIDGFYGAGGEQTRDQAFELEGDHPKVLVGADQAPTPVELTLHALATCLTAGMANIAAARGITLHEVRSTLEGHIDLQGVLGIDRSVRNGWQGVKVTFSVTGDAPREELEALVARSQARSAVFDIMTNGVPVDVRVEAHPA